MKTQIKKKKFIPTEGWEDWENSIEFSRGDLISLSIYEKRRGFFFIPFRFLEMILKAAFMGVPVGALLGSALTPFPTFLFLVIESIMLERGNEEGLAWFEYGDLMVWKWTIIVGIILSFIYFFFDEETQNSDFIGLIP